MAQQNSKCGGTFGPSDIPTGSVVINIGGGNQILDPMCRGLDFLTAGNIVVVYADNSVQTVAGVAGSRWSGHIKQITAIGTTATGYALK